MLLCGKATIKCAQDRTLQPSDKLLHSEITHVILGAFYDVYNHLGPGFLESVYEASLVIDLLGAGVDVVRQSEVPVYFKSCQVGKYLADLIVERKVVVELKAVRSLNSAHEAQVINLLKATGLEVGLVLNFGPQPQFKRLIYTDSRSPGRTEGKQVLPRMTR
jgi:GxxExxY protein